MPSQERLRELFDYNPTTGNLHWKVKRPHREPGDVAGTKSPTAYRVDIKDRHYMLHRVIWVMHFGAIPDGLFIDHINGDPYDNRLENLRLVTNRLNMMNRKLSRTNTSGAMGVVKVGKKWRAQLKVFGVRHIIGIFENFEDAVKARRDAEREHGFHPNHGRVVN